MPKKLPRLFYSLNLSVAFPPAELRLLRRGKPIAHTKKALKIILFA